HIAARTIYYRAPLSNGIRLASSFARVTDFQAQTTVSISARRLDWLLRLLLAAGVIAVFWPVLRAGFVNWDDEVNIVNNPHLGLGWANIKWMFTDTIYVRRYLPLVWLSYTIVRVFFG